MSLKCIKCGKTMDEKQNPGEDKAGICLQCVKKPLTQDQERDLEKHGTTGYIARQHR